MCRGDEREDARHPGGELRGMRLAASGAVDEDTGLKISSSSSLRHADTVKS